MSSNEDLPNRMSDYDGWRAHELSQFRRFRALSLRQKLEAVGEHGRCRPASRADAPRRKVPIRLA